MCQVRFLRRWKLYYSIVIIVLPDQKNGKKKEEFNAKKVWVLSQGFRLSLLSYDSGRPIDELQQSNTKPLFVDFFSPSLLYSFSFAAYTSSYSLVCKKSSSPPQRFFAHHLHPECAGIEPPSPQKKTCVLQKKNSTDGKCCFSCVISQSIYAKKERRRKPNNPQQCKKKKTLFKRWNWNIPCN